MLLRLAGLSASATASEAGVFCDRRHHLRGLRAPGAVRVPPLRGAADTRGVRVAGSRRHGHPIAAGAPHAGRPARRLSRLERHCSRRHDPMTDEPSSPPATAGTHAVLRPLGRASLPPDARLVRRVESRRAARRAGQRPRHARARAPARGAAARRQARHAHQLRLPRRARLRRVRGDVRRDPHRTLGRAGRGRRRAERAPGDPHPRLARVGLRHDSPSPAARASRCRRPTTPRRSTSRPTGPATTSRRSTSAPSGRASRAAPPPG